MNKAWDCLVDTCIWRRWSDPTTSSAVEEWVTNIMGERKPFISVITFGEIKYGFRLLKDDQNQRENELENFLAEKRAVFLEVSKHVVEPYGWLRAALFEKYAPKEKRKKKKRPEELKDPTTAKELGIQENDLWIASQAIWKNLILLTEDKMHHLRGVAGGELHIELWKGNGQP